MFCRYHDGDTGIKAFGRVVFQVRVKPGTYNVCQETIGAGRHQIDPLFRNSELEWSTRRRGIIFLVAILVKMEKK